MKLTHLSVIALLAVAAQGAFAQSGVSSDPRMGSSSSSMSGSSMGGGGTGSATDGSAVSNIGSAFASDSTTTVDSTTTDTTTADVSPTGEMINTGGEPELMLLVGVLLATGGLLLRRKASAFNL